MIVTSFPVHHFTSSCVHGRLKSPFTRLPGDMWQDVCQDTKADVRTRFSWQAGRADETPSSWDFAQIHKGRKGKGDGPNDR